jgi:nucleoside-diphosphate-sugar epimerase
VTGGAGFLGAVLVPKLLGRGYSVRILDLFLFGDDVLQEGHHNLRRIRADIRDLEALERVVPGVDAIIHLAGISNDPGFELNPLLGKSVNFDSFEPLVSLAKSRGVSRFVYASTASVYGGSGDQEITEEHPLAPITDYDRFKGLCEPILFRYQSPEFTTVSIRSATVCGYSPRQRLDLVVNMLTNLAAHRRKITLLGGGQHRPSLHVDDLTDLYADLLELPAEAIAGQSFNAVCENYSMTELANRVCDVVHQELPEAGPAQLEIAPMEQSVSYNVCASRIERAIGWSPKHRVEDAVVDLCRAFRDGKLPNSLDDPRYYNVKMIQTLGLV